ncbi:Coq4 family protein [Chamaesiphon sp.]|uniref:Coq4 family protein n=1 Tax=Chamaesiphon sp. TaxID=2814140 RepID=UPI003593FC20
MIIPNQTPQSELLISSFLELVNTKDGDFTVVAKLFEASNDDESMQLTIEHLCLYPPAKQAFTNRLRLGTIDLDRLSKLAVNTLGRLYADRIIHDLLEPIRSDLQPQSDLDFLNVHITETHDLWHVVTGTNTDMLGEIQLEALYIAQLKMSRFWLALITKNLLKSLLYDIEMADRYLEVITKGWMMGHQAQPLFGVNWSNLWETPIEEVRASLNVSIL